MRRWNGWGDESFSMEAPGSGLEFLRSKVTPGSILADIDLASVCAQVP